ncbi:uncharacterized protein LOC144424587 [Styela clava]
MAENMGNSEWQVDYTWSTSRFDSDLVYHFVTFLRENQNKHSVLFDRSIREIMEMRFQIKERQNEIHGTNNGGHLHSRISTAYCIELLQKMTRCLKYMHDTPIDPSCVYLSKDKKQFAIASPAPPNNIESLKYFAKFALYLLSNGRVSDKEDTSPNDKTFNGLKEMCKQGQRVNASSLLSILIKEKNIAKREDTNVEQGNISLERIEYLTGFLCCKEPILAFDLVTNMYDGEYKIEGNGEENTNYEEILRHSFFWSETKKCLFVCAVFEYFKMKDKFTDGYKTKYDDDLRENYKMSGEFVFSGNGWIESLEISKNELSKLNKKKGIAKPETIQNIAMKKNHKEHSLYDLMRFFRNRYTHFLEDEEDVKHVFENSSTGFWNFFASKYSCFFYYIHSKMWPKVEGLPEFKSFSECAPESTYMYAEYSADP